MRKSKQVAALVAISLLITTMASATPINAISNSGFETGSLYPWQIAGGSVEDKIGSRTEWHVSNENAYSGQYCLTGSASALTYEFETPIPIEDITSFSVAILRPSTGFQSIRFFYDDDDDDDGVLGGDWTVPSQTDEQWHLYDVDTSMLETNAELCAIKLSVMSLPTAIQPKWDNFSLMVVPEPATLAMLALISPILCRTNRRR